MMHHNLNLAPKYIKYEKKRGIFMVRKFGFNLPTRIEFGTGILQSAGKLVSEITVGHRAFLVSDAGLKSVGLVDKVAESLIAAGFEVLIFDQVKPNPRASDCEAGGEAAKTFGADLIVALGGGSVLDSAKAIALLQTHGGPLRVYEGRGKVSCPVMPIIAIPTTAGTGSEVTRSAVITDTERQFKMTVKDLLLAPKLALVDPETTYSLPKELTASTGMDALVHAIEAYTCTESNPMAGLLALEAMRNIYPALPRVVRDGSDYEAREAMMFGSLLAGLAFSHADVAAVHCMAEAVGGLYDIPHGVANSIFLPVVTAYNASSDYNKHAIAALACGLPVSEMSDQEAAEFFVHELALLAAEIGIPRLKDLNQIDPSDFPRLAQASAINGSTPSNCRPVSEKDYLALFQEAYGQ
jgi:alcohol dehydrogenase